ncbi:MAG TPA: ANTAR domain-containing protein [Limnochordales bacterium]
MSQLEVVALGFDPADPAARLPRSLVETGWPILLQVGWPSEEWLARQRADLFVLRAAGVDQIAERTRTIGRVTGRPVIWLGDPASGEPEGLWQHLTSDDWPVWAVLPVDAPRWQVVAVARSLVAVTERLRAARREVEEAARKLEDRKLIERAKGILMDRFELAESEAYRRLRETAMRQRKPLREIAQSIIEFAALERPAAPRRRSPGAGGAPPTGGEPPKR